MASPFYAFTRQYGGKVNRITTPVTVYAAFNPKSGEKPGTPYPTEALWDTGATGSVITASTAVTLGLIPTGLTRLNHAKGTSVSNTYMVNFFLPNKVGVIGALVAECEKIDSGDPAVTIGAIIGMDIICQGDLSITNANGATCMSFRTPSITKIDYALEARKVKFSGVGRNDPCPCGAKDESGKPIKFKRCHGK